MIFFFKFTRWKKYCQARVIFRSQKKLLINKNYDLTFEFSVFGFCAKNFFNKNYRYLFHNCSKLSLSSKSQMTLKLQLFLFGFYII